MLPKRKIFRLTIISCAALILFSACVPTTQSLPTIETTLPKPSPDNTPGNQIPEAYNFLPDEDAIAMMDNLITYRGDKAQQIADQILEARDVRFISVFIELMRGNQIGIILWENSEFYIQTLESLSGQEFGNNWQAWMEWYGKTELEPPPGFLQWKGKLLSHIDPQFADFLYEGAPNHLRVEEIVWGGVLVDGIPALNNPKLLNSEEASYLPNEPVFGVSVNDDARAYPLRIMDWHEMVNDVVGGVPVSLAYCTLCGAGIAFDGRASDGETYTFGSSGLLYRSNKLMYDHQTQTLWNQLTGEPVLGELADDRLKLNLLPVVLTSWQDWKSQHPNTKVLSLETGYNRPYELGAAYGEYFASPDTMFPVWQRSGILQAKSRVYALNLEGVPKAYPLDTLITEKVVNDTLNQIPIVLVATRSSVEVDGEHYLAGKVTYNAGGEVRAYQRDKEIFKPGPSPDTIFDSSNNVWQVQEEALIGPQGKRAPRVNGHLTYWFGWYAFFPKTLVYGH